MSRINFVKRCVRRPQQNAVCKWIGETVLRLEGRRNHFSFSSLTRCSRQCLDSEEIVSVQKEKKQTAWKRRPHEIVFRLHSRHFHFPPIDHRPLLFYCLLISVTTVERRPCGSGTAWKFLGLLGRPPGSLLSGSSESSSIFLKGFLSS